MACKFFSGYETGDTREWTGTTGGTVSVQSSTLISGGYTMKYTSTGSYSWVGSPTGLNAATLYMRLRVRFHVTTNPSSLSEQRCVEMDTSGNVPISALWLQVTTGGGLLLYCYGGGSGSTPFSINADQTYLLEMKTVVSATVGIIEFKLDGTVQGSLTGLNTGTTNIDRVYPELLVDTGSVDMYVDDMYLDDAAYPGAGKCITRQGKAGTPTYDAWTKTSSQTAAQVWSTTPFSATNNAALAGTAAGAQTMLTESFSTTQSGHGTETIGSNDTINACKVGLIAKVSSTSSPPTFSIRRRLNGADTDTNKTLTTSDVYYETSIFTDTLTNLNAAEIGANRGTSASSRTDTVEDAWFIVDYTLVANASIPLFASLGVGSS